MFEQLLLLALLKLPDHGHAPALQIILGHAGRPVPLGAICKGLHRLEEKGLVEGRYGRTPEHEFVGAVRDSQRAPARFRHMSDKGTHMPQAKSSP
jgi:hypothetical protein